MLGKACSRLADLLYPRCCPICGKIVLPKGQLACSACIGKLSFVKEPVCKKCGKELASQVEEYCLDCLRHKRSFEFGRALANYDHLARQSMAKIKYKNKREYLDFYAQAICARYGKLVERTMEGEVLVPVPIHPSRLRQRGYNQAGLLAKGIGARLGLPVEEGLLIRNKKTAPQKGLGAMERLKNLEEAFAVPASAQVPQRVVLVDDIYTTGSTMEACARALKRAGAKKVYFLVACIGSGP